jgi:beta-galactosidase
VATAAAAALLVLCVACGGLPLPYSPSATARQETTLAGPWKFRASNDLENAAARDFDDGAWETIRVPHTWAARDPRTYRRAWYRTHFMSPAIQPSRRAFLSFEGVATIADVYLNGRHLGQHRGAYTRFLFDATEALLPAPGENVLAVRVSNDPSETADCLPSGVAKQHYDVYGGIYRKVRLLQTELVHIDPTDNASPGVKFTPRRVDARRAEYAVEVLARNADTVARTLTARSHLVDAAGRVVDQGAAERRLEARAGAKLSLDGALARPLLWGPGHPALYDLHVELWADGRLVDRVSQKVGFRDFRMRDGRFYLNGEPTLLRGVGKHQETETAATAISDRDIDEDFANLADLGVNMVRLAHYPHAALAYDLADRLGILVWAENGNSNPGLASATGETITREMIRQNQNHPSIVIWSVGNESDYRGVARYAAVVRAEDGTRLVTYASSTGIRPKAQQQLDFIARNSYLGWYADEPAWDFEDVAPKLRYVSETGGGAVISQHCDYHRERMIVDVFEPEEYRQLLAEAQFQTVFRTRPQDVPLFSVWLLRDFVAPAQEKFRGINTKGLLTRDNFRKDAYYLYRAFLRPEEPTVHLASKTYFLRRGVGSDQVKAFSNQPFLTLTVDGGHSDRVAQGRYRQRNGRSVANVFHWRTVLHPGRNVVRVTDDAGHSDETVFYFLPNEAAGLPQDSRAPVLGLRSSNPRNPAYLIDAPVQDQWPFYYEFDGTADNTFATIPATVRGAAWIATRRLSRPENRTRLDFRVAPEGPGADVWIAFTADAPTPVAWLRAGFSDTGESSEWRDTQLRRAPLRMLHRGCRAGEAVRVDGVTRDYVVLVRRREPAIATKAAR